MKKSANFIKIIDYGIIFRLYFTNLISDNNILLLTLYLWDEVSGL